MPYWADFLTLAAIHFLAIVSPGPDFAVVSRNSLAHSRRIGVWTAVGIALGILVHVTYCVIGVAWMISQSPAVSTLIRSVGAAYLIYIGWKSLRAAPPGAPGATPEASRRKIGARDAVRMGFLTNALNPKATLFFLGLFTQAIRPSTPLAVELLYGVEMVLATLGWFVLIAVGFSHPAVVKRLAGVQHHVERVMGLALAGFGAWMGFSTFL